MKTLLYAFIFALMSISLFAQPKDQPGRYQIYKVASMTEETRKMNSVVFTFGSGGNEDVLLLDTQTGRTWMLNNFAEHTPGSSPSARELKFEWREITYSALYLKYLDESTLFPPPDKKKK